MSIRCVVFYRILIYKLFSHINIQNMRGKKIYNNMIFKVISNKLTRKFNVLYHNTLFYLLIPKVLNV